MDHHQLDIFNDSRDVCLRNDIAAAIVRADLAAARLALVGLRSESDSDSTLGAAQTLIDHLVTTCADEPLRSADEVLTRRRDIETRIAPAARQILGPAVSAPWLTTQWRRLADTAHTLPWQPDQPDAHAASIYLQAGAWTEAAEAAGQISSWRRIPQPLLWMTQACWRRDGADATWPLLVEAFWLAPTRAAALIPQLDDSALIRLARRFEADFDPDGADWAWMPAWALIDRPLLAAVMSTAEVPPRHNAAEAFQIVMGLLRMERAGRHHDIIDYRKRLRGLSDRLFAAYMATR